MKHDETPRERSRPNGLSTTLLAAVFHFGLGVVGATTTAAAEPPSKTSVESTMFKALSPQETGIDFVNPIVSDHPRNYLFPFGYACGGVSIGDLDGDGRPDVFCVGGPVDNGLFLQDATGDGMVFTRVEDSVVGGGETWGTGASLVDIDGDGDLDIYVCNYDAPNQLFVNRSAPGAPEFTEEAAAYGLDVRDASVFSTFADVDNDGDLDVYIGCNRYVPAEGLPTEAPGSYDEATDTVVMFPKYERYFKAWKSADGKFEADSYGRDDYFLLNRGPDEDGRMRFDDVTATCGIDGAGHALSATWLDVDRDGRLDLHVANDFEDADRFYRNLGTSADGTVRFEDAIADILPYTTWSSMGADVGDLDGDGMLDLMVADMAATTHFKSKLNMGEMGGRRRWVLENGWPRQAMRNMLYLDTGLGTFREAGFLTGLDSSDWTWAVKIADFDQDGRPDVFFTNGMSRNYTDSDIPFAGVQRFGRTQWDHYRDQEPLRERNMAFRNRGDLVFEDAGGSWGLDRFGMTYGAAYGDLDLDGDLDLVTADLDEPISVYRNDTGGNWFGVRLESDSANRRGIGAVVTVRTRSHGDLVRMMNPWTGWASTNDGELHFGLGEDAEIEGVEIVWPGGGVQRLGPARANQRIVVREPDGFETPTPRIDARFVTAADGVGPGFVHRENDHDDFRLQPLLPGKLSAFGPCMAWGDVNADGMADVFFGGAKDQSAELWIGAEGGRFLRALVPVFARDRASEDSDACWLDVEGDGDLDLVVLGGSTEHRKGDRRLRNRLYLNEGNDDSGVPTMVRGGDDALGWMAESSGTVAAEDIDGDGDVDLFVGGRSVPGRYPATPTSQLLLNETTDDGIRFTDVTERLAPDLGQAGLVTDAVWTDIDADGRPDLVVSTEWGPVRIWRNDGSRFVDSTEDTGLAAISGWWSGVHAADLDGDGDQDLIALNVGLNTKYGTPDCDRPAILYYGDMDGTGRKHLVEAKLKKEDLLPIRGRSCSSNAMPFIRDNFATFREFAKADLPNIYTPDRLRDAKRFEANGFESGVWLNRSESGTARYEFAPFPRIAQISPAYDVAVFDVDGDGVVDLFLAQNHDHREPETGVWRAGVGQLLKGRGDGRFDPVHPRESGILLRGDATGVHAVDIDQDGDLDIVATQNDDAVATFLNRGGSSGS